MRYRKKPIVVDAIQLTDNNRAAVAEWLADMQVRHKVPMSFNPETGTYTIETLEGNMLARIGDFIIRGVKGELYPCKPDIFYETYEPADA